MAAIERLYGDRLTEHVERLADHAFRAEAWEQAAAYGRQAGAKAEGRAAFREAVAAFGQEGASVELASPATPEAVFWAAERARGAAPDHVVEGMPGVVPDRPDPAAPALHPRSEQAARAAGES